MSFSAFQSFLESLGNCPAKHIDIIINSHKKSVHLIVFHHFCLYRQVLFREFCSSLQSSNPQQGPSMTVIWELAFFLPDPKSMLHN